MGSGTSFHTTPYQEIIQNYVVGDFGKVYLADGIALNVVGMGDVWIVTEDRSRNGSYEQDALCLNYW